MFLFDRLLAAQTRFRPSVIGVYVFWLVSACSVVSGNCDRCVGLRARNMCAHIPAYSLHTRPSRSSASVQQRQTSNRLSGRLFTKSAAMEFDRRI